MRSGGKAPASRSRAFTLVELLTVVSIVALLGAILQPAIAGAKRDALKSACQSNLHQIGLAFRLYGADWDDRYPCAIDIFARESFESRSDYPGPIELIPDMVATLSAYTGGRGPVWRCPADTVLFSTALFGDPTPRTYASANAFAGTSYLFDELHYFGKSQSETNVFQIRLCSDAGTWHSEYSEPSFFVKARNVLFMDGHVRFASMNDRS